MSRNSLNYFENITFNAYDFISTLHKNYRNAFIPDPDSKLFSKFRTKKIDIEISKFTDESRAQVESITTDRIISDYSDIMKYNPNYKSKDVHINIFNYIRQFALYLITMEKSLLYDNTESDILYATINDNILKIIIKAPDNLQTISISYEKTKIIDVNKDHSILGAVLNDKSDDIFDTPNILMTRLEILSAEKNEVIAKYNFISSDEPTRKNRIDEMVVMRAEEITLNCIKYVFNKILSNIINTYYPSEEKSLYGPSSMERFFIYNGFRIKK